MKELYRLGSSIIRSSVASRKWAPWARSRLSLFSSTTNAGMLFNLSSRLMEIDCRHLSDKTEMNSHVNFSDSTADNCNGDEGLDSSLAACNYSTVKQSDSLEAEPHQTELDVCGIVPALPKKSFSLAPYVNESQTLRHLVMLGVNLSRIEDRDISLAEKLVKLDFEHDVKPVLLFLHHCGVKECDIGECISRNARLLFEPIDDMQVRANYLESKRFSKEVIARIVSKAPSVLTATTKATDAQLGYLQQNFMLSGNSQF